MYKLKLHPDSSNYSYAQSNDVLFSDFSVGQLDTVLDFRRNTVKVAVSFTLTPKEYRYFRLFYYYGTHKGSVSFIMDLVLEMDTINEHVVNIEPNSLTMSQNGLAFNVNFNVYAVPFLSRDINPDFYVTLNGDFLLNGTLILTGRL